MPKEASKKLENPALNRKNQKLSFPEPRNKEEAKENEEWKWIFQYQVLMDLMKNFGIDPEHESAWKALSYDLANHYVPAMRPPHKVGQPKKWDWISHVKLYGLFQILQRENPQFRRQEIFNAMPKAAQNTTLSSLISSDVKAITLETRYDKFNKNKSFIKMKNEIFKEYSEAGLINMLRKMLYNE